jgi:hypothetical protein
MKASGVNEGFPSTPWRTKVLGLRRGVFTRTEAAKLAQAPRNSSADIPQGEDE